MSKPKKRKEYDVLGVKKQGGFVYFQLYLDGQLPFVVPDNAAIWKVDEKAIKTIARFKKRSVKISQGGEEKKTTISVVEITGPKEEIEKLMYAVDINLPDIIFGYFDESGSDSMPDDLIDGFGHTEH